MSTVNEVSDVSGGSFVQGNTYRDDSDDALMNVVVMCKGVWLGMNVGGEVKVRLGEAT